MATYLLDTNILLRMSDSSSSTHLLASQATAKLIRQHHEVFINSQNIIEFWAVATRPVAANGLGLSVAQTRAEVEQIMMQFPMLENVPQIFGYWLHYVTTNNIKGKRVHDARLIAVMLAHNISHLLTFNGDDFVQTEGITIAHPQMVMTER